LQCSWRQLRICQYQCCHAKQLPRFAGTNKPSFTFKWFSSRRHSHLVALQLPVSYSTLQRSLRREWLKLSVFKLTEHHGVVRAAERGKHRLVFALFQCTFYWVSCSNHSNNCLRSVRAKNKSEVEHNTIQVGATICNRCEHSHSPKTNKNGFEMLRKRWGKDLQMETLRRARTNKQLKAKNKLVNCKYHFWLALRNSTEDNFCVAADIFVKSKMAFRQWIRNCLNLKFVSSLVSLGNSRVVVFSTLLKYMLKLDPLVIGCLPQASSKSINNGKVSQLFSLLC